VTGGRWQVLVVLGGALAIAAGCGAGAGAAGGGLGFGITLSGAVADQATGFQVALLSNGASYNCAELQKTCLHGNPAVPDTAYVSLTDSNGQQKKVITFPNALADGGSVASQEVSLEGLSPGKDFAVVVEAVAAGELLGSACRYVPEIRSGVNATVLLQIQAPPADAGSCDPAFP
jgi:hypothetical protein